MLSCTAVRNGVQLIAYADRLGGSLAGLRALLTGDGPLAGLFSGVHVLPFFTPYDGADAGFDPVDHLTVDPRLGTWDDVRALADAGLEPAVDVIVNHVSSHSAAFRAVVEGGAEPGMFLTMDAVFAGGATEADLLRVYRPRPGLPFTPVTLAARERRLFWTTFTSEQIDIDVGHPDARAYLSAILRRLAEAGVRLVRLDAVGYAVKQAGTSCFMTPATFAFIDALRAEANGLGLEVLVEVHSHVDVQKRVADHADHVYDFALPPLVLHALGAGDLDPLVRWFDERPRNAITVLDTHDGIGIIDVGADQRDHELAGLLDGAQIDALVEGIHVRSGGGSRRATGAAASNVDLYQVNCTFYDALGRDDDAYLLARAIQLLTPGLPQIYYVGLLAGGNDLRLLDRTGVGRDVNRHAYTPAELDAALARPVVRALLALVRLRGEHPAFAGTCRWERPAPTELTLAWEHEGARCALWADVAAPAWRLEWTDPATGEARTAHGVRELAAP